MREPASQDMSGEDRRAFPRHAVTGDVLLCLLRADGSVVEEAYRYAFDLGQGGFAFHSPHEVPHDASVVAVFQPHTRNRRVLFAKVRYVRLRHDGWWICGVQFARTRAEPVLRHIERLRSAA
ncbi:MAG: PilZ domain-containing protein [Phycisphaerales bacterium]